MPYRWLLFDADGTLFDFDRAEASALEATLADFNVTPTESHLQTYRQINQQVWRELEEGLIEPGVLSAERFQRFFSASAMEAEVESFSPRYLQHLAECSTLIDGAEEVVRSLSATHQMMIITNGLKDVQRPRFQRSRIREVFADIIISEEVGSAKPAHGIFDEAFRRMGWPAKDQVLIIGDSLSSDIQGGVNYGIDTCWFNPMGKPAKPDLPVRYEIDSLTDLLDFLT